MNQSRLIKIANTALKVRSDLRAGRTVCYQLVEGGWVPILDSNAPVLPTPAPVPPAPPPGVQLLDCQSCTGSELAPGVLANATCSVCYL